ncbi:hypothetical protein HYALB_00012684 [Hymenoscyphus albidus]|uniref:Uncharacterized protein n=1 Tax=Hymenoscyphus albidus TaxID=595503 RepID=A0A9N9LV85_9HELO|nr:hypothetical protein HYALB_00012684 [Hymenoscyphus albidus]
MRLSMMQVFLTALTIFAAAEAKRCDTAADCYDAECPAPSVPFCQLDGPGGRCTCK